MPNSSNSPLSPTPNSHALPEFTFYIQNLNNTISVTHLKFLSFEKNASLEDFRIALQRSELGDPHKDLFYPGWTFSLHILQLDLFKDDPNGPTVSAVDQRKVLVDTAEKFHALLQQESETPGSIAIVLQQCRSKRYSRKKELLNNSAAGVAAAAATRSSTANSNTAATRTGAASADSAASTGSVAHLPGKISISPVSSRNPTPPGSPRPDNGIKEQQGQPQAAVNTAPHPYLGQVTAPVHPGAGAVVPGHEVYPYRPEGMFMEHFLQLAIVTPPSLYPQCYPIPLGVAAQPVHGYGYVAAPTLMQSVFPTYPNYS